MTTRATALLSDGTRLTSTMGRRAGAAWALWRDGVLIASGFSRDDGLARQAARKIRNTMTGRTRYNAALRRFRFVESKREFYARQRDREGSFSSWNQRLAEIERAYRIEVVPTTPD
ncbi:MAG: hypothetical protein PHE36_13405 [Novosphingobium sp.]|nr:hypothetical protein [Novosphingobium sp.]